MKHITYAEWLPVVLGRTALARHNLLPVTIGYSDRERWLGRNSDPWSAH